ncbi:DUF4232 domain-containing protein [Actinomycetospora endophytica]|uniref:DUF4232 domain-containing protein n=1 Tax=Actinomycetospora endophytica TaxID=2291215 RepID=A0ABS8P960_9PSEU|nr:DUF4232 domain-containing protein [Actinomycetospora endophytica]MCD2194060.1 DUF4232 domain-containing protein [Actinomycetospora endophytica]
MLQPVGPLPPSVYWRRRAVAIAAAVLVLALLVWAIAAAVSADGGSDVPAAAPPAPAPASGPPEPVASRGALPPPSDAAALLGSRVLPGTPSQTGNGSRPGAAALPGADSQPGGAHPGGEGRPGGGASSTTTAATPSSPAAPSAPSAPASPSVSAPQAAAAPPRCADGDLRITARTDKPRYTAAEHPLFSLVITNTGSTPCSRDLDAARQAMAVVIKPGDGLWGSNDCSPAHSNDVRTLAPGQETVFSVRWAGRRSSPGCSGDRSVVPPGDYELLTRLDGTISDPAKFTITS